MNDELLRLAERCEAATGPDREIDCLIFELRFPELTPEMRGIYYGEPTGEYFRDGGETTFHAPKFTASLDAAMTLVPELNGQAAYPQIERVGVDAWHAHLGYANKARGTTGRAQKPALALCAAALRSRAHPLEGE